MIDFEVIDASSFDPEQWNSCNHLELTPKGYGESDYIDTSKASNYTRWYKPDLDPYLLAPPLDIITLPPSSRKQLCELNALLQFREWKPRDDLIVRELCDLATAGCKIQLNEGPYFIRCDECSTKDVHSYRPVSYASLGEFLKDIVLSKRLSAFLNDGRQGENFTIIVCKWMPWVNMEKEFRVFIQNKRITAISQYVWHKVLSWSPTAENVADMVQFVETLFNKDLIHAEDISMDLYVGSELDGPSSSIKLVELGPFGGHTGCGSCLFHWVRDQQILYNGKGDIVVRLLQ